MYKIQIDEESARFLKSLPKEHRADAVSIINSVIAKGCEFLKPLDNRHGFELTGCYSAYFGNTAYRIIFEQTSETDIIIWNIGARQDFDAFREADRKRKKL